TDEIVNLLVSSTPLREVRFSPLNHHENNTEVRFAWRIENPLRIATSIRSGSYLSHASAAFVHKLATKAPPRIIVNKEQSAKPKHSGKLRQAAIDRAFAAVKQRSSTFVFKFNDNELVLLSGKHTSRLGVTAVDVGQGKVDVTSPERTLIDIAVRPSYAGGIAEVLQAYRSATQQRISVSTLIEQLEGLQYTYPYHKAIGYYMERAGFPKVECNKLKALGTKFNFYLTYGMKEKRLNRDWKIYIPAGFET